MTLLRAARRGFVSAVEVETTRAQIAIGYATQAHWLQPKVAAARRGFVGAVEVAPTASHWLCNLACSCSNPKTPQDETVCRVTAHPLCLFVCPWRYTLRMAVDSGVKIFCQVAGARCTASLSCTHELYRQKKSNQVSQGWVRQALSTGGADVDAANTAGVTPLIASSFFGHEAVVRALLSRGADARAVCARRRSALHYAALADQRPVKTLHHKPLFSCCFCAATQQYP